MWRKLELFYQLKDDEVWDLHENVQVNVPLQHEVARIVREPINSDNIDQATEGPAISEEEHEVVLSSERPVINKEVVPKERVRLEKETIERRQPVFGEVRKEVIDEEHDKGNTK